MAGESEEREPLAKLTIELFENDRVRIDGPVDSRSLCYTILGLARDAIQEYHLARQAGAPTNERKTT